ncbi:MAG: hypothetical protein QME64_04900, partial [bacterium]|nr:hypothetical protein [bacterium]
LAAHFHLIFNHGAPSHNLLCEGAPALMVVPLVITALAVLGLFLMPSVFLDLARMAVDLAR